MQDDHEGIELLRRSVAEVVESLPKGTVPRVRLGTDREAKRATRGRFFSTGVALAAAAVLLVLVYPAYLGLVRLPAVRAERDALLEGWETARSGPVDLDVVSMPRLPGSTRSGVGSPSPVRIFLPGDRMAILLVELAPEWLEPSERSGAGFRVQIAAVGSGAPVAVWEASEARVLELIDAHEGLPLLVRGRDLPAGHYRLSVGRVGDAGVRDLSFLELEVTASPSP